MAGNMIGSLSPLLNAQKATKVSINPDIHEACTVNELIAKRIDPITKKVEYLISWKEYQEELTWEPVQNLFNV